MNNLRAKYINEALPKLKEEFQMENDLACPAIEKVVINAGASEALTNKEVLEKIKDQMSQIAGQLPRVTRAKKSISTFKLKQNDPIGVMVTLRGKKAWDFLERFVSIVVPRTRDFRGIPQEKFDEKGNYSLGIQEQILFPEIDYAKIDKIRGLVVTIVVKNSDKQKSHRMLELLGLPFKKNT